ncbi:MAG TPA: hypothetical protein VKB38_13170 [Terracidiphilus sp.]|nr:hypothetical protein [Terracidiphilus sp.]
MTEQVKETLEEMKKILAEDPQASQVYGCCVWFDEHNVEHQQTLTREECATHEGNVFAPLARC